jgi:hypothetical protein
MYFSKINYRKTSYDASGASVDPTPQVRKSAMLVLPSVGNLKLGFRVEPNGITSIPNFIRICPAVLELNYEDRRTDIISLMYAFISCTSCEEYK